MELDKEEYYFSCECNLVDKLGSSKKNLGHKIPTEYKTSFSPQNIRLLKGKFTFPQPELAFSFQEMQLVVTKNIFPEIQKETTSHEELTDGIHQEFLPKETSSPVKSPEELTVSFQDNSW